MWSEAYFFIEVQILKGVKLFMCVSSSSLEKVNVYSWELRASVREVKSSDCLTLAVLSLL